MYQWYFAENHTPSNEVVDKLIDSKFGIDKLGSFVREIIQNSIDAYDDSLGDMPVKISFSVKDFTLEQIPGGERLREILSNCYEVKDLNHQTKDMYERGLKDLNSSCIRCLKISDENTTGVEPGLDKAWGAFVYDEGVSKKRRPGSAGSHGVGKKAPFIISGVHTVFYSTNYKNQKLFQGKTMLVDWSENGKDYVSKGWFGNVDLESYDRRNKIQPIEYDRGIENINDFFLRKDKKGTDVIVIDANFLNDIELAKQKIIVAILENFFVAIIENKLECIVFGQEVNNQNFNYLLEKYYNTQRNTFSRSGDSDTVYDGNLNNYYRVFSPRIPQKTFPLIIDNVIYGYLEAYIDLINDKGKKYYCIVRDHGMKIRDYKLNSDNPFTAVIVVRDNLDGSLDTKEMINYRLASRENAAHDDFIINDEQVPCDPITERLINMMYDMIKKYILELTEIKAEDKSYIENLSDMLSIPGSISNSYIKKNTPKIKITPKRLAKPGKGMADLNGNAGTSNGEGPGKRSGGKGQKKKVRLEGNLSAYIFDNYAKEPIIIHSGSYYSIKFIPAEDCNATVCIKPVSFDGGNASISNLIVEALQNQTSLKIIGNAIKNVKLCKNVETIINLRLRPGLDYVLSCDVLVEVEKND